MGKIKNILAGCFVFIAVTASLYSCLDDETDMTEEETSSVSDEKEDHGSSGGKHDTGANGSGAAGTPVRISRSVRETETPMGDAGTWTVFVYMCGSDLESDGGMASADIEEMEKSSAGGNVKFVVQTGGAYYWENDVDEDQCQRYLIHDGRKDLVFAGDDVNMGEGATLTDFAKWGIKSYPAANMGFIFWDHGSGSINGVCFDENHDDDGLYLKEIDAAFYSIFDEMTEPFEFIGFDACLMGTAETAAVMSTHAKYMVASEETEPGTGWDYKALGDYMAAHPECDGAELGKAITDSYYSACEDDWTDDEATMAVIDLGRTDAFITAFDRFAEDIYTLTDDITEFSEFARKIKKVDNFGGNNRIVGYTNMVDLSGLIKAGKDWSENADAALDALENMVVYRKNGSDHKDAGGLAVYYPLSVSGSEELGIFSDIALSSYYLGVVDKIAYGAAHDGMEGYDNQDVLDLFSNDWSDDGYTFLDGLLSYLFDDDCDEWDYADDYSSGEGGCCGYDVYPEFSEDGNYWFRLSEESLVQTESVEAGIYMALDDEREEVLELGTTGQVYGDYETGEFEDGFDGCWFMLDDGQILASYLQEYCDGYDIYTSPVMFEGEETNLRFAYYYNEDRIKIIDIWDGIGDNGLASRSGYIPESGDVIVPLYSIFSLVEDEDEGEYYEGDEYVFEKGSEIFYDYLDDGDYLYSFVINDIYGDFDVTDPVWFTIDGDDIYFEEA